MKNLLYLILSVPKLVRAFFLYNLKLNNSNGIELN